MKLPERAPPTAPRPAAALSWRDILLLPADGGIAEGIGLERLIDQQRDRAARPGDVS